MPRLPGRTARTAPAILRPLCPASVRYTLPLVSRRTTSTGRRRCAISDGRRGTGSSVATEVPPSAWLGPHDGRPAGTGVAGEEAVSRFGPARSPAPSEAATARLQPVSPSGQGPQQGTGGPLRRGCTGAYTRHRPTGRTEQAEKGTERAGLLPLQRRRGWQGSCLGRRRGDYRQHPLGMRRSAAQGWGRISAGTGAGPRGAPVHAGRQQQPPFPAAADRGSRTYSAGD